jgi:hypothetical protein
MSDWDEIDKIPSISPIRIKPDREYNKAVIEQIMTHPDRDMLLMSKDSMRAIRELLEMQTENTREECDKTIAAIKEALSMEDIQKAQDIIDKYESNETKP